MGYSGYTKTATSLAALDDEYFFKRIWGTIVTIEIDHTFHHMLSEQSEIPYECRENG